MGLNITANSGVSTITITGNIKSLSDAKMIQAAIQKAADSEYNQSIVLNIVDSFIITSSVIGALVKFISKDKLPISMRIGNSELHEMLVEMELNRLFNAARVSA
jgi:CMP-N-acetylneuraminic acid synthetase